MATAPDLTALATWDATETGNRIARKDVSATEVVEAAIARAEEARHLGGLVAPLYERARARAQAGVGDAPLAGVPTFVKDLAHLRGAPIAWGSRATGHYVSRKTDVFVRRFEETGVVTLGKSATPELGLTATTEPLGREPCRNPWDPTRSTGGSSGGAACLVAAGVVPMAHASDGGGSIRIPAACCGLVGLKPSRYRLDMEGSTLLPVNVATDGVVTRTVRDTVAFWAAIESGRATGKLAPIGPVADRPAKPLRLGVFVDAPIGTPVDPEVQEAARAAGRLCRTLGHEVDEIACPFDGAMIDDFLRFWGLVAWLQVSGARLTMHWGIDRSKLEPWTVGMAAYFGEAKRAGWAATKRLRGFGAAFARVMERYDVLVSPTVATPAPPLGYLATDAPFDTAFARLRAFAPFTPLYNASGTPAISLPLARSAAGLPIGVQLAAARGHERLLLELALSIEAAQPWERTAPRTTWLQAA